MRVLGHLSQLATTNCDSLLLKVAPSCCSRSSDASHKPFLLCRVLHPRLLFFRFLMEVPKTFLTSLLKLSQALISVGGLVAPLLSHSDLDLQNWYCLLGKAWQATKSMSFPHVLKLETRMRRVEVFFHLNCIRLLKFVKVKCVVQLLPAHVLFLCFSAQTFPHCGGISHDGDLLFQLATPCSEPQLSGVNGTHQKVGASRFLVSWN